jgi:hypothetical protein
MFSRLDIPRNGRKDYKLKAKAYLKICINQDKSGSFVGNPSASCYPRLGDIDEPKYAQSCRIIELEKHRRGDTQRGDIDAPGTSSRTRTET